MSGHRIPIGQKAAAAIERCPDAVIDVWFNGQWQTVTVGKERTKIMFGNFPIEFALRELKRKPATPVPPNETT